MTERASTDRWHTASGQLSQLNELIALLVEKNPFYAQRIKDAGIEKGVGDLEQFSRSFPPTTKKELAQDQNAFPPYGTNLTFALDRYVRFHQTSATTGSPLRWLDTPEDWAAMLDNWDRVYTEAGVSAGDSAYFAFSFGPFIGFWTAFDAAARRGCLCLPGGGLSSLARLRAILDNKATTLCCTPTYALRLAEVANQEGIDLEGSPVRSILVAGEPGGCVPMTRKKIEAAWPGAHLFDHHGMTEVGPVSYQRKHEPCDLRVIEEAFFAEVLQPGSNEPVTGSGAGELVLTTLRRRGAPLLRYRTGDIVRMEVPSHAPGAPRDVVLRGGILGRADDMVLVRGVNVYPSAIENLVREFEEVAEYQVQLQATDSMTEIRLLVEPVPSCSDSGGLLERLASTFKERLNLRVPMVAVEVDSLPRFEMKARRWHWL